MNFLIFLEFVYHALLDGIANEKQSRNLKDLGYQNTQIYPYEMKWMFSLFTCVFNHTNIFDIGYSTTIWMHQRCMMPVLFFSDPFHSV